MCVLEKYAPSLLYRQKTTKKFLPPPLSALFSSRLRLGTCQGPSERIVYEQLKRRTTLFFPPYPKDEMASHPPTFCSFCFLGALKVKYLYEQKESEIRK